MEDYRTSQKDYEKAIYIGRHGSMFPSRANFLKIALAQTKIMHGEKDIKLNEIFKCCEDTKIKMWGAWMGYYMGKILLNIDDQHLSEAEDWIKKAIQSHKKYGMMWHLARDYALYAELFKRKDDQSKARENIGKAIEIFTECGADGWVEKYEKELAEL